ncbi:hypothetical protein RB3669 [Rhodopirellula baltica SH 1]|uniref:Uncharacterized protein n=1 Tax=Rhodopirellula baltica (strain DSM 10527 / NCIMB 13988 / SH1) TaxID=243090 RepID=Q7UTU9_RHOBA|nr:hypothetical protein RB3669 [Rhodopirellula baltica SH 1]
MQCRRGFALWRMPKGKGGGHQLATTGFLSVDALNAAPRLHLCRALSADHVLTFSSAHPATATSLPPRRDDEFELTVSLGVNFRCQSAQEVSRRNIRRSRCEA